MTMSDFELAARNAAAGYGCSNTVEELTAFLVGAQWCLDQTLMLEASITQSTPSDEELRAGAEALLLDDAGLSWMEATPHQRYQYTQWTRTVMQAVNELHSQTKEEIK